ncbi:unnamed protein product [Arabidopsis lyrata]|uniref:uncharacterized protein LOC110227632 n=1 Tax=Arabidopsis lyrata subsp. lyrata TaxID=81972 RepID=UPI000A29C9A1|nr:uncharacterized protein LOC110227632 [Arabidopsis lyrata subsp. lyrata]CAH8270505.1 unnamed protein product [Arabidopsis lyrata]|eukprot:XP_020878158.1 uncharacterized protein LOC110227632 [Arabidopsis lyrata subsp. lyrata]
MSLLLNQPSKLPVVVRSSPLGSNGFSSSLLQTPPCSILGVVPCHWDFGQLVIWNANDRCLTYTKKKVSLELTDQKKTVLIGSSHGWVATLKDDGRVRLQDDLNPVASDTNPKHILLPPLVTLPHCQTQIVTNVAMSSSSPEDEDCVVAVKFMGPQLSFCRPAQRNSEWINIRIENPCFFSSRVMFSKKDNMFRIPGSGGHLIASWDLSCSHKQHNINPKFHKLRFENFAELTKTRRERMHSCFTTEHLVESRTTGEMFVVKLYRKTVDIIHPVLPRLNTQGLKTLGLMVFRLDEQGNAVYTQDIGDLCIFISRSEPFCVPASSFPGMCPNRVKVYDFHESGTMDLANWSMGSRNATLFKAPYYIPPQNISSEF